MWPRKINYTWKNTHRQQQKRQRQQKQISQTIIRWNSIVVISMFINALFQTIESHTHSQHMGNWNVLVNLKQINAEEEEEEDETEQTEWELWYKFYKCHKNV